MTHTMKLKAILTSFIYPEQADFMKDHDVADKQIDILEVHSEK